ncbi:hypothetical protein NC652_030865 [Populus alba x Populus x berolinensis]|nr:hypothetical protein NC652_030865 [Populus alba x Populus x berolinensis]
MELPYPGIERTTSSTVLYSNSFDFTHKLFLVTVVGWYEILCFEVDAICNTAIFCKDCANALQKKFPESKRVGRLEAMVLEAKGSWGEAEKAYPSLLEDNPFDQVVHKRRVALAKAQGNLTGAIDLLNKYLETFLADHDAWRELAEIYISLQISCLNELGTSKQRSANEELILSQPTVPLYHLAYADVLYTLGGIENLLTAKKYYSSTIDVDWGQEHQGTFWYLSGKIPPPPLCVLVMRASILLEEVATSSLGARQLLHSIQKDETRKTRTVQDLQSLATAAFEKEYKQRAS